MSKDNFFLKIYTPKGLIVDDITNGVYFPTVEGEIGVLPQHIKYVGILGTGLLTYTSHPQKIENKVAISEGICYFDDDGLTLLAEDAAKEVEGIDIPKEISSLTKKIEAGPYDDPAIISATKRLKFLKALSEANTPEASASE